MTRHSQGTKEDPQLREALAVLISSTRSRKRSLSLPEIAKWLQFAVAKLGGYSTVADRIDLSSHMLRQFSRVSELSPDVQLMFRKRELDSVDAATHLAMLPTSDQLILARALASHEIDTSDVRAAIRLRRVGQSGHIMDLIRRVKAGRTKREFVAEFVLRGRHDQKSVLAAFRRHIPADGIVRLDVEGAIGRLVLTPKGKKALASVARSRGVPLKQVIPAILHD